MATIKLIIKSADPRDDGKCPVYVQIMQNGKAARIKTKYFVEPKFWDKVKGRVIGGKTGDPNATKKNFSLAEILIDHEKTLIDNEENIRSLDALEIKKFLESGSKFFETDFFKFTETRILELKANRSPSARHYANTLTMVRNYHSRQTLNFNDITKRFLESFVSHYQNEGHKVNSIATYLRYIKAIYNLAIDEFNTNPRNPVIFNYPFRKFEIKTDKTTNRNLSVDTIRQIRDYDFKTKREQFARDIFTLQIYLLGINIIDLFYMPKSALVGGRLQFYRRKTGRYFNIKIEQEAKEIIEKYQGEKYLLRFADNCNLERKPNKIKHARLKRDQWGDEVSFNRMINENLGVIQGELKFILPTDLTSYYSRHSFASIMRSIGISKDTISLALGHKDVEQNLKTSGIYIVDDFKEVDLANRELIDYLNSDFTDGREWKDRKQKKPDLLI